MGLGVWFEEDVARVLAGTYEAMSASLRATATGDVESQQLVAGYQRGYVDALRAVAVAFGIAMPNPPAGSSDL